MTKFGVLGSCLSNLPGSFLEAEYGWTRLNNVVVRRSDHFRRYFVERTARMPPYAEMARFLGVKGTTDADVDWRFLNDDYPERAGRHAMDFGLPSFVENLKTQKFDVFLLDNLFDTHHPYLHYKGSSIAPFSTTTGLHLYENCDAIASSFESEGPLAAEASAANWVAIIEFLHDLQPQARFFFSCGHYCTSADQPERYWRAFDFYWQLVRLSGFLSIEIVPPITVTKNLTKWPQDLDHLDMRIYRALAGQFYLSKVANLRFVGAQLINSEINEAADYETPVELPAPPFSLTETICTFLGLEPGAVDEAAGMNVTEGWDSLRQLHVLTHVEVVAQVKFAFHETTDLTTVSQIRDALRARNVAMADDPAFCPGIFADFLRRAVEEPDGSYAIFVKGGVERDLTNRSVLSAAVGVGTKLDALAEGAIVAIILDHDPHLYGAFIGCVLHGLVPTILPPLTAKQDVNIFRDSMAVLFARVRPSAIVSTRAVAATLPPTDAMTLYVEDMQAPDWRAVLAHAPDLLKPVARGQTAFLQHSSGTTGHKKGVMLTHPQVAEQIRHYGARIGLAKGDIVASWLPLYHDMGLITSFLMPTMAAARIVSLDALEWVVAPGMLFDAVEKFHAHYVWLPNFAFHHLVRACDPARRWNLGSVKAIVSCSEPCRTAAFEAFSARFGSMGLTRERLQVSYAMAENVFAVTQTPAGEAAPGGPLPALSPYLSSGRPLPGVEIEIRDAAGQRVAEGELGEICIRTTSLFDGYYKLPEITAERLRGGWYETRDLGALHEGELYVIGRVDDLLIVNGKNVVAHELEDALAAVDGVAPGRILIGSAYDEDSGASRLMVLAEPLSPATDAKALSAALRESIYALSGIPPHRVQILPKGFLLKSTSGKLARTASFKKFEEARL
jgi:acyl-CoA synthetase (AMP-forming)/AMP-acid ligase II